MRQYFRPFGRDAKTMKKSPYILLLSACVIPCALKRLTLDAVAQPISVSIAPSTTKNDGIFPERGLPEKRLTWQKALSAVGVKEGRPMVVDLRYGLKNLPPYMSITEPHGAATMRALARAIRRTWKQSNGVQIFMLGKNFFDRDYSDLESVATWIASLNSTDRKQLLAGETNLARVKPEIREKILNLISDRDLHFALLEKSRRVGLHLRFDPTLEYAQPHIPNLNIPPELAGVSVSVSLLAFSNQEEKIPEQDSEPIELESLQEAAPGVLDFGNGVILTLHEMLEKAAVSFKIPYSVEKRSPDNLYFISGQFSQRSFEKVLQELNISPDDINNRKGLDDTKKREINSSKEKIISVMGVLFDDLLTNEFKNLSIRNADITSLRDLLGITDNVKQQELENAYGSRELLPARDFVKGTTTSVADLSQGKPGLAAFFDSLKLQPDSRVKLKPGLALIITTEGFHDTSLGFTEQNGKIVPMRSPNQTEIRFALEPQANLPSAADAAQLPRAEDDPQNKIATAQATVKVGQAAPDFDVKDADGKSWKLSTLKGKKAIVLTFFPKCFTGGCANHLSSLRDHQAEFDKNDVQVLAVSVDPAEGEKGQKAFAQQWKLLFPLIPDTQRVLSKLYGAVQQNDERAARMTFLIDKAGIVRFVDTDVHVQTHGADVLAKLRALGIIQKPAQ